MTWGRRLRIVHPGHRHRRVDKGSPCICRNLTKEKDSLLAIVEPLSIGSEIKLVDRPNLGCASLVAAVSERGIDVRLFEGQTRLLANLFRDDVEEYWELIHGLTSDEAEQLGLTRYRGLLEERGPAWFAEDLAALYDYVFAHRSIRHSLNGHMTAQVVAHVTRWRQLLDHWIGRGKRDFAFVSRLVSDIVESHADHVGLSVSIDFDPLSYLVLRRLREATDATLILGGSLTPFIPEDRIAGLLGDGRPDYLVVGEAEGSLPSLLEALQQSDDPFAYPNIYGLQGGRLRGRAEKPVQGLELPIPDFSQLDLDTYLTPDRVLPLQSARGCTWRKCAFCEHHRSYGGKYRPLGIERLLETMLELKRRYSCTSFTLQDEEIPPGRARHIAQAILAEPGLDDVAISTYGRLVPGYDDRELAALLYRAGFRTYEWGLESGSQRVLDAMCKGTQVTTMGSVLDRFSEAGIANRCFVFFGFPGETLSEAQETVDFLKRQRKAVARVAFGRFLVSEYSDVHLHPDAYGLIIKPDGTYENRHGMTWAETDRFVLDQQVRVAFGDARWDKGDLHCISDDVEGRLTDFLCRAHGLVSREHVHELLAAGDVGDFFIVLLGHLRRTGESTSWQPISVTDSHHLNARFPLPNVPVDPVLVSAFRLADGTRTVDAVAREVAEGQTADSGLSRRDRAKAFLTEALAQGTAVAFRTGW